MACPADDVSSGHVTALLCSDAFRFPTAVAVSGKRLLVVNAQLNVLFADSPGG